MWIKHADTGKALFHPFCFHAAKQLSTWLNTGKQLF
jgi:hypothetical protein